MYITDMSRQVHADLQTMKKKERRVKESKNMPLNILTIMQSQK